MEIPPEAGKGHGRARVRRAWLVLLVTASLAAAGAGTNLWPPQPDEWVTLIEAGDILARVGGTMAFGRDRVTARTSYLLAFHHAQDAADVPKMLVAADRLERLGEHALAAHIRHVAHTAAAAVSTGE